jgi:hypothetical protein
MRYIEYLSKNKKTTRNEKKEVKMKQKRITLWDNFYCYYVVYFRLLLFMMWSFVIILFMFVFRLLLLFLKRWIRILAKQPGAVRVNDRRAFHVFRIWMCVEETLAIISVRYHPPSRGKRVLAHLDRERSWACRVLI